MKPYYLYIYIYTLTCIEKLKNLEVDPSNEFEIVVLFPSVYH